MRVVHKIFGTNHSQITFDALTASTGWSLDSWIQAAANHFQFHGHTLAEFHTLIEDAIYEDLRQRAATAGVEQDLLEALRWPRNIKRRKVIRVCVCEFLEREYANASLLGLVR